MPVQFLVDDSSVNVGVREVEADFLFRLLAQSRCLLEDLVPDACR